MPDQQRMLGKADLVLVPQYAVEGTGPANFEAQIAAGAAMTAPLQKGYIEKDNIPDYEENEFGGYVDKQGMFRVWEDNMSTLKGRLLNTTESLRQLVWAMNADSTNTKGPEESRTFLYSYKDADDDEIFCVFRAGKPASCTVNLTKKPGPMIDIGMKNRHSYEAVKPTSQAGWNALGFANAPTKTLQYEDSAVPLRFADLGDLLYKPVAKVGAAHAIIVEYTNIPFRAFTGTVTWKFRKQDSNGDDRDLYYDYAGRDVSGSADMFKAGHNLNEDAKTDSLHVAIIQLEKATTSKKDVHAQAAIFGTAGANNQLVMVALVPGAAGNGIKLTASIGGASVTATTVKSVRGRTIDLEIKNGGDTISNIASVINGHREASQLVSAVSDGAGSVTAAIPAGAAKTTAGGTDAVRKIIFERFKWEPSNENLIESTDDATIESKSFRADAATAVIP